MTDRNTFYFSMSLELIYEWLSAGETFRTCVRNMLLTFRKAFDRVGYFH